MTETMRRCTALALALVALLAACTQSKVDANADIQIGGQVRRQNGTAVKGAELALTKGPDLLDVFATITSLGLACLTEEFPNACRGARKATTNGEGAFEYDLKGRDTQGNFGQASTLAISTHLPRSAQQLDGAAVTMRFQVQTERLNLPLRLWEPRVTVTGNQRRAIAHWSRVPPNILPPQASIAGIRTSLRFERDGQRVWVFSNAQPGLRFDPRYLEDTSGSAAVVAEEDRLDVGASFGTKIDMVWRSARYPYVSPVGAPVSRGKGCLAYDRKGRAVAQAECRLTDGDFEERFDPHTVSPCSSTPTPACTEPPHRSAFIDLGSSRALRLVVVRGCEHRCVVETSGNAKRWRLVGSGGESQESFGIVLRGGRARFVRVRSDLDIGGLHEVSVWDNSRGTPPRRTAGSSLLTDLASAGQRPLSKGGGGGFPWKPITIVLALIAIAGAAFALGRVRRAPAA